MGVPVTVGLAVAAVALFVLMLVFNHKSDYGRNAGYMLRAYVCGGLFAVSLFVSSFGWGMGKMTVVFQVVFGILVAVFFAATLHTDLSNRKRRRAAAQSEP